MKNSTAEKTKAPESYFQGRPQTYLLRQMIRAEVEGCDAFASLGFVVDDAAIGGLEGIEFSEASPAACELFFFLAICAIKFGMR